MKTFAVVTLCLLVVARANANCNLNLDRKTRQLFSSSGLNFPGPRTKVPIRNTPPSTIPPSSIPTPPLPKQVPISARIDNHSKKASKATNRPLHVPAYVHNGKAVPFKSSPQPFENQRQKHQSFHSFTQERLSIENAFARLIDGLADGNKLSLSEQLALQRLSTSHKSPIRQEFSQDTSDEESSSSESEQEEEQTVDQSTKPPTVAVAGNRRSDSVRPEPLHRKPEFDQKKNAGEIGKEKVDRSELGPVANFHGFKRPEHEIRRSQAEFPIEKGRRPSSEERRPDFHFRTELEARRHALYDQGSDSTTERARQKSEVRRPVTDKLRITPEDNISEPKKEIARLGLEARRLTGSEPRRQATTVEPLRDEPENQRREHEMTKSRPENRRQDSEIPIFGVPRPSASAETQKAEIETPEHEITKPNPEVRRPVTGRPTNVTDNRRTGAEVPNFSYKARRPESDVRKQDQQRQAQTGRPPTNHNRQPEHDGRTPEPDNGRPPSNIDRAQTEARPTKPEIHQPKPEIIQPDSEIVQPELETRQLKAETNQSEPVEVQEVTQLEKVLNQMEILLNQPLPGKNQPHPETTQPQPEVPQAVTEVILPTPELHQSEPEVELPISKSESPFSFQKSRLSVIESLQPEFVRSFIPEFRNSESGVNPKLENHYPEPHIEPETRKPEVRKPKPEFRRPEARKPEPEARKPEARKPESEVRKPEAKRPAFEARQSEAESRRPAIETRKPAAIAARRPSFENRRHFPVEQESESNPLSTKIRKPESEDRRHFFETRKPDSTTRRPFPEFRPPLENRRPPPEFRPPTPETQKPPRQSESQFRKPEQDIDKSKFRRPQEPQFESLKMNQRESEFNEQTGPPEKYSFPTQELEDEDDFYEDADDEEGEPEEKYKPDKLQLLLQESDFTCIDKKDGYYADEAVNCEVFHYCQDKTRHSWLCPEGAAFHQVHLICMPVDKESICKKSSDFHFVNDYLYKTIDDGSGLNSSSLYADRYYPEGYEHGAPFDMDKVTKPLNPRYQALNRRQGPVTIQPQQPYRTYNSANERKVDKTPTNRNGQSTFSAYQFDEHQHEDVLPFSDVSFESK